MTSMSDGFIAALKAGFLATKKRPTTVIARLHFKDLLLLNHNNVLFKKIVYVPSIAIKEKSPKLQHVDLFLFLSHLSANLLMIKTMKNLAGKVKNVSLIPGLRNIPFHELHF